MSEVIDRFVDGGVSFEVYGDGDCVVRMPSDGFVQISAALLARLTRRQPAVAAPQTHPKTPRAERVRPTPNPPAPAVFDREQNSRLVKSAPDGSGWECFFVGEDGASVRHVYKFRQQARSAKIYTQVGEGGRLS